MTVGIYALKFDGTNKVYIGQSTNIEYRFTAHLNTLKQNRAPKKLQDAYNLFGTPRLEIVCVCSKPELDSAENDAIEIFDSYSNGSNTFRKEGGSMRSTGGLLHPNSKYTRLTLLKVFVLLYKYPDLTYANIASRLKVNQYLVNNIALGTHHLWLKQEYPMEFECMLRNKEYRKKFNVKSLEKETGKIAKLQAPDGTVYEVNNIRQFCMKTHPFSTNPDSARSSLGKVIKGVKPSHLGWTLVS